MANFFLLKTEGGPFDGEVRALPKGTGPGEWTWPLPEKLLGEEIPEELLRGMRGNYVKVMESELPEEADANDHLSRGATYRWVESG
jgi:hypothetical protein